MAGLEVNPAGPLPPQPPLLPHIREPLTGDPSLVGDGEIQNETGCDFTNYKNILQQYAQKARSLLPYYSVVNEGSVHAPQFRGTVSVCGTQYTSPKTFAHRKAAEQDAARHAMENMPPLSVNNFHQGIVFCKSILNELQVKINLEKATYSTVQPNASVHAFQSTVIFNGHSYTGEVGRSKKEAEQLAARAVIVSLLGSDFKTILTKMIQSKAMLYASLYKATDYSHDITGQTLIGVSNGDEVLKEINAPSSQSSTVQDTSQAAQPHHEFKNPGLELSKPVEVSTNLSSIPPITSVPPSSTVQIQAARPDHEPGVELSKLVEASTKLASIPPITSVPPSSTVQIQAPQPDHEFKKPVVELPKPVEAASIPPITSVPPSSTVQIQAPQPDHEFKKSGVELSKPVEESTKLTPIPPITSVPPSVLPQSVEFVPPKVVEVMQQTGRKKRKRKSKNKKHLNVGAQAPSAQAHPAQVTCSTAQ